MDPIIFKSFLIGKLLDKKSPYRAFYGSFWQGDTVSSSTDNPTIAGRFINASLTHLGALEVMTIDQDDMPKDLRFIPFDSIRGGIIQGNSLLRPSLIYFEFENTTESFWVPLLYGASFEYGIEGDQDGSTTRFMNQFEIPELGRNMGLGLGQQDFLINSDSSTILTGLGSIHEFAISLEMDDIRFDEKCFGRGLDPIEIKKQHI